MSDTPFFPVWRGRFSRRPATAVAATYAGLRRCTLDRLEARFAPFLTGLSRVAPARAASTAVPYELKRHSVSDPG